MTFRRELTDLLNKYSQENISDTPDFILANYIQGCLDALNGAVVEREKWYGRKFEDSLSMREYAGPESETIDIDAAHEDDISYEEY